MCLNIKRNQAQNEKELENWLGSRRKFAYVYKILRKNENEDFYRSELYQNFKWDFKKQKEFQVNRSSKPTEEELKSGGINEGFHVYMDLEEAKLNSGSNCAVIVKFKVCQKDIVAINTCFYEAVCTRLEFVKILED